MAAILWRYAGSPAPEGGADYADEDTISAYASTAVDWARDTGVVSGVDGNRFLPGSNATRAQVATILRNYLTMSAPVEPEQPSEEPRVLVAYFSATGNTERVANAIAEATGGDLFELTPVEPYTDADLNWTRSWSPTHRTTGPTTTWSLWAIPSGGTTRPGRWRAL